MKTKRYRVVDLQGANFMEDTYQEPQTLKQLRERFWGLYQNEELEEYKEYEDFTKEYIEDLWEVVIKEVQDEN